MAGTLLLALTLSAYALAMTIGHGRFGLLNIALLSSAVFGVGFFVFVEARATSPLIQLTVFRNPVLSASLAMNALVSTVMMATLVVAPFYLSQALRLNQALVGIVMSIGPVISILSGVPAGRLVDRLDTSFVVVAGLVAMTAGSIAMAVLPGISGYITAIAMLTTGYQLFQAANNTAVMADVRPDQRGVISGMLNLSRNVGLITGASMMGAVFALASGTSDVVVAHPEAVASGMQITFAFAATLVIVALAMAAGTYRRRALGES